MNYKLDENLRLAAHESRHQCFIYDGPPSRQLSVLATMIERKLEAGYRCMYLNSRPMVAGIRFCLATKGMDVVSEVAKGRLILSSDPVVSADGDLDTGLLLKMLEDALDQALLDGHKGLWATGDMTWEFGSKKNLAKLMEYEHRLEELFHRRPELCGICQYHQDTLPREVARQGLLTHRSLFINETLARTNPCYVPATLANDQLAGNAELDEAIIALRRA